MSGFKMGALAPLTAWIPEDDLLLKNAVEAGASLESLAKGAVRFSRRYTIRELQDRWYSLLYDSDISTEASARILELELSVSSLPKSDKPCTSRGKQWTSGKRKVDSVRSHYYALRKRICNEPCNSVDLDFLVPPSAHICTGNDGYQEHLKLNTDHSVGNCLLGASISSGYGLQDGGFDIVHHGFPQMVRMEAAVGNGVDIAAHTFHNGHVEPLVHDGGVLPQECLYGFSENVSPVTVDKSVGKNIDGNSFEHDNLPKDVPEILGENVTVFQSCSGVQEMEQPQTLPPSNLFETDDVEAKPLSTFDSLKNNEGSDCSGFGGNQNFGSPVSDCGASFHQLGYSSPLPSLPIWRAIEDITPPVMQIEASFEQKHHNVRANSVLSSVGVKKMNPLGYDAVHSEPKLNDGISGDGLNGSTTISEGDLMELSNSLLNFTNEEELLYMDVDEKDLIDRSCFDGLNSLLLSSPNDVHQDDISNSCETKTSTDLDTRLVIPDGACSGELDDIHDPRDTSHGDGQSACELEVNVPATSTQSCHVDEGLMFCALNTEDPEIPCNDDFLSPMDVLPSFVSAAMRKYKDAPSSFPPSNKELFDRRKASEHESGPIKGEHGHPSQPTMASMTVGSLPLPVVDIKNPSDGNGGKNELLENNSSVAVSRLAAEQTSTCMAVPVTTHSVPAIALNEDIVAVEAGQLDNFGNSNSLLERPIQGSDHPKNSSQNVVKSCKLELDGSITLEKHGSAHAELHNGETGYPEPSANFSISDQEDLLYESDEDVPYFSDIEAMILDMDLGPSDQESYFTREVSRYQYEDTKKAIVRLEQGAHSYMQRAIASHGAFAVFYGRHLKHYIKKAEVSLGRATEDVHVDIDLGREGRANKISRRQAIIKMEDDGSFYLKNLGKCSIVVNSKEVATGQHFNLTSSCLIEIRGMRFMFEMNQKILGKCTTHVVKTNSMKERNTKSEFLSSEIQQV